MTMAISRIAIFNIHVQITKWRPTKNQFIFHRFLKKKYSKNQNFEIIAVCDIAIVILNLKPLDFSVSYDLSRPATLPPRVINKLRNQ